MELDWYCTRAVDMKQQSWWGVLWFFKRPQVRLLEKQRNRQHHIWCLITNTRANRVAIFCSAITRCLTLENIGWSPFTLQYLFMFGASVFNRICCQFICCCLSVVINLLASCFDSNSLVSVHLPPILFLFWSLCFVQLLSVRLFDYSVSFSVLILEL